MTSLQHTALLFTLLLAGLTQIPQPPPGTPPSREAGLRAFDSILTVLRHPRCINCHPSGDRPMQGMEQRQHYFNVQRGPDGHGVAAMKCGTCHQRSNNPYSGVPGAPHWHLAPRSMGWVGLSDHELGAQLLDPERNGGITVAELEEHMLHDSLVLWGWAPGVDRNGNQRELPPLGLPEWRAAVKTWIGSGTPIPSPK